MFVKLCVTFCYGRGDRHSRNVDKTIGRSQHLRDLAMPVGKLRKFAANSLKQLMGANAAAENVTN